MRDLQECTLLMLPLPLQGSDGAGPAGHAACLAGAAQQAAELEALWE